MKKIFTALVLAMFVFNINVCFADTDVIIEETQKPTAMEKLEDKAQTTMENTEKAMKSGMNKAKKATKKGAIKAGEATKSGAIKAGKATKRGAIRATNWSAKKLRDGAQKLIEKTEEQDTAED